MKADVLNAKTDKYPPVIFRQLQYAPSLSYARKRLLLGPETWFRTQRTYWGRFEHSPRQVNVVNDESCLAENFLVELKEAYRRLPRHIQIHVACLLRESAPQEQSDVELAG